MVLFVIMKNSLRIAYFTVVTLVLMTPSFVFGQGLVPQCSRGEGSDPCQFCHVVELVNNVVAWLVAVLGIIAALIIIYAGFLMVASGGNASAKEKAKGFITNIVIGYVLVLGAWILIDTGFRALIGGQSYGMWNQIQCVDQPRAQRVEERDRRIINLGGSPTSAGRYSLEQEVAGNFSEGSGSGSLGSCQVADSGPCSESSLRANGFGDLAGAAAQIAGAESGCNPNAESRTDTTSDGRTYSVGTWQINLAAHPIQCTNSQNQTVNLNCPSAFEPTGTRNRYNVRVQRVTNESLYQACVDAARDPDCNNQIAARLARNSGDMGDWACSARRCGVSTSRNSSCPL